MIKAINLSASKSSFKELDRRKEFYDLMKKFPEKNEEMLYHLSLFISRQVLSRMLYFNEIYQKIVNVPGIVIEFGTSWGRDVPLLINLRGIYEPYNYTRKIVCFDSFEGLPRLSEKDGKEGNVGDFKTSKGYEKYLEKILEYHEFECPLNHVKKFEIVKGDVCETLPKYLNDNPETIVALAYFDLDLYEPTKECLKLIKPCLIKGSVLALDDQNFRAFPGETIALKEVLGLNNCKLRKVPCMIKECYMVYEE